MGAPRLLASRTSVSLGRGNRYDVLCLAAGASLLWLTLGPRTPDLSAQVYRADLFRAHGFVLYDPSWYAGHDVPGYSLLLLPPLAALLGARVLGVLAAITAALCFERLAEGALGPDAAWPARCFALGTVCDLVIGRIAYALGVALGLAALLAWQCGKRPGAAVLAVLCAVASPVAGLFVALAATALALGHGRLATLAAAAVPVLAAGLLELVFPEGGRQPFALSVFVALLGLALAGAALLPASLRVARVGLVLYAAAIVASFAIASPMGSNVERLGAGCFAAVFLAGFARPAGARRAALLALAIAAAGFQWVAPVSELAKVDDNPEVDGSYYAPLLAFLRAHGPLDGRVEVPFTAAHWEAEALAPHVALARGWERQLDVRYDALFYDARG